MKRSSMTSSSLTRYNRLPMMGVLGLTLSLGSSVALADGDCLTPEAHLSNPGSLTGQLDADDTIEGPQYGSYHDAFTLNVVEGEAIVLSMVSAFDGMLFVQDDECSEIAWDDDSEYSLNPQIVLVPPYSGQVTVIATSYGAGEIGEYVLSAEPYSQAVHCVEPEASLEVPETVQGALDATDQSSSPAGDGHYSDGFALQLFAGESVALAVTSADFDAMLYVVNEHCEILNFNDDFLGYDPYLEITATEDGAVEVIVTSYDVSMFGDYVLDVFAYEPPPPIFSDPVSVSSGRLRTPDIARGTLAMRDPMNNNRYYDAYALLLRKGQRVEINMPSTTMDTYLVVQDADGAEVARNDDFDGYSARVAFQAERSGRYTVIATSYLEFARGRYELRVGNPATRAMPLRALSPAEARGLIRKGVPAEKVLPRVTNR